MNITQNDILNDIAEYEQRISASQKQLAELPMGFVPYGKFKKLQEKRHALEDDIKHVESLIRIARSALIIE